MIKKTFILFLSIIISESQVGTTSANFLGIGLGATGCGADTTLLTNPPINYPPNKVG